jgi:hypothetical protein
MDEVRKPINSVRIILFHPVMRGIRLKEKGGSSGDISVINSGEVS